MQKIKVLKHKDVVTREKVKQNDSKAIKTPKITLKNWLSDSQNNINKRKQSETIAFFG